MKIKGFISWNGFFYCYKESKSGCKYYKSKNVRFENKTECSEEEYFNCAQKFANVMGS